MHSFISTIINTYFKVIYQFFDCKSKNDAEKYFIDFFFRFCFTYLLKAVLKKQPYSSLSAIKVKH